MEGDNIMIIGYEIIGTTVFSSFSPLVNACFMELKNIVADEFHVQNISNNSTVRENWTSGTVLLTTFNGDLEAGNIQMRENSITGLRVKRRKVNNQIFTVLKEFPFTPEPTQIIYDDYSATAGVDYEYMVVPYDETGIEGIITTINAKAEFEGWWLVDPHSPEDFNFQFFYNLDDINIETDEDRTELTTFGKYPLIRYGQKRARKGTLSSLFIPEGDSVVEQYQKLDNMLKQHKTLLLKDGLGRSFLVDVSSPAETVLQKPFRLSRITVSWVEVEEYND